MVARIVRDDEAAGSNPVTPTRSYLVTHQQLDVLASALAEAVFTYLRLLGNARYRPGLITEARTVLAIALAGRPGSAGISCGTPR